MSEQAVQQLEEERDALKRELVGTQEMLAFVLQEAGEVEVMKTTIKQGFPEDVQIAVEDEDDRFVFKLVRTASI